MWGISNYFQWFLGKGNTGFLDNILKKYVWFNSFTMYRCGYAQMKAKYFIVYLVFLDNLLKVIIRLNYRYILYLLIIETVVWNF